MDIDMGGFNHPVCVCCGEGDGREMDEDGACEDCATQRRYLYATKRFFIVATDDFRDNLRIQQGLGSCLRNMISLSEPVNLEPPNGSVYPIEAKGEFGDIVFRNGWKEFVSGNHIEENDSILFVYRGNSRFKVHVFDSSGHEKSSCSPCSQTVGPPPSQNTDLSSSDDDDIMRESERESGYGAHKPHNQASMKLGVNSDPLSSNLREPFQRPYILARHTTLPMQVKKKVQEKVQAIESELPIFVKEMTTTNIDGGGHSLGELMFGMVYASACLPDKTHPLILRLEGRKEQWRATLYVGCRNQRRVYEGWNEFVRDNQLKPGDICLFEVSSRDSTSLTMTVHLVR
ncbi:putative B3 domain-containing protein Os03g0621600 [Lolium perenne]|uniref:putative B3 domain-containing protein Os03g0621600 n=1 Tax=Lolium perenne TaxID=4522 RepID=UPI0021F62EF7|nr:B3 domain-containing protein Os03g0619600-like [Lolium perenne]